MIRRSLIAFLVVLIVSLLFVVGYAAFNLSGPETTVDDAAQAFQRAEYSQAIRKLDIAERSLGSSGSTRVRVRILQMRREAHLRLDNLKRALEDIEALAAIGRSRPDVMEAMSLDPEQLEMDRIYYTLRSGDGERSLELSRAFLQDAPEHPRALELAGEASFALFADQYNELKEEVDERFDAEVAREADELLKIWLYRDETDPLALRSYEEFRELLRQFQPTNPVNNAMRSRLQELRRLIQQAQSFCRAAIVAPGGQPVAAYQLLRTSLGKGQRSDDVQALAETYLARFDHVYTIDAASDLAELHVENERYRAAVEICVRFLPYDAWRQRLEEGRLSAAVGRLWAAKARALLELGDRAGAKELGELVDSVQASGQIDLGVNYHWIQTLTFLARRLMNPCRESLREYDNLLRELPQTDAVRKKLAEAVRLNLRIIGNRKDNFGNQIYLNRRLTAYEPTNPAPYLRGIELMVELGQIVNARNMASRLRNIDPQNEDLLRISCRLEDIEESETGRGSSELLDTFLRTGTVHSSIPERQLWPIIAQKALENGHFEIAYEAATRAASTFNWAKWPRLLQAEAAFALNDPERAKEAAAGILTFHPEDAEGLLLLERARELSGEPNDDLVFAALSSGRTDATIAQALLRAARERHDFEFATAIANQIRYQFRDDPASLLVVADFYLSSGKYFMARKALELASTKVETGDTELYAATQASALMIAAIQRNRDAITTLLDSTQRLYRGRTKDLFRFAQVLSELGRGRSGQDQLPLELAYDLLSPILTDPEHRDGRSGVHFVLGGKLALKLGKWKQAHEHLNAALRFEDDGTASRDLTLLNLAQDSGFDPSETFWEKQATDLTSACLHARIGNRIQALAWAESQRQDANPSKAAIALRALLDPSFRRYPALTEVVERAPAALLDTLTFLEAEGFEAAAIERASELFNLLKSNQVCSFFLARAFAQGGNSERALEILDDLMAPEEQGGFVWAHEEAARLLQGNAAADDGILGRILEPFTKVGGLPAPASVRRIAMEGGIVQQLHDPEKRDSLLEALAKLWIARASTVTLDEIWFMENERPDLALEVFMRVEPHLPPAVRPAAITTYFRLVRTLLERGPNEQISTAAGRKAERVLQEDGNYGAVVHFILDRDDEMLGALETRQDPERVGIATRLLEKHIEMFLSRRDDDREFLLASLRRLATLKPLPRVLALCEKILRHDPSLVDVWLLRAEWLMYDGQAKEAYDSLRWIEGLLPRDPARMRVAELRARLGEHDTRAVAALRKALGDATFELPEHAFVRGLLALRAADYEVARTEFEAAMAQPDGGHLYFRALADLATGSRVVAGGHFAELAAGYPTSLLSENAGQFASFCSH